MRNFSVLAFVWTGLSAVSNIQTTAAVAGIEQGGTRLYTDYVAYCSEAKAVLVNQFDISYFKANHSVVFQISAASVEPNLNISANIYAVAYGMQLLNYTINLCDYLEGVLCPLPQINFTGKSISMPCAEEESNVSSSRQASELYRYRKMSSVISLRWLGQCQISRRMPKSHSTTWIPTK
jgi:hypothetical protein